MREAAQIYLLGAKPVQPAPFSSLVSPLPQPEPARVVNGNIMLMRKKVMAHLV